MIVLQFRHINHANRAPAVISQPSISSNLGFRLDFNKSYKLDAMDDFYRL